MKGVGRSSGEEQWARKRMVTTYSLRSSVFLTLTLLSYTVTAIVCTVEATSWDRERCSTGEIHNKGM